MKIKKMFKKSSKMINKEKSNLILFINNKSNIVNYLNNNKRKYIIRKGSNYKYKLKEVNITKNIIITKYLYFLLNIFCILINIFISSSKKISRYLISNNNEIKFNINRTGEYKIININYKNKPSSIIVNGEKISLGDNEKYNFTSNDNSIIIQWDQKLKNCSGMFYNLQILTSIDLSNFDTSEVTEMQRMFANCYNLKYINFRLTSSNLSSFNTSSVTNMRELFSNCYSLISLDLSSFNTSSVTNMMKIFSNCNGLTSLDLSSFNTPSVTNMIELFSNCNGLTSLDLSSFNTSSVTNMRGLFSNCYGLTLIVLSSFDTSSVTNMNELFSNCYGLTSLDLSSFNTSSVINMKELFSNCYRLTSLDLSSFDTSSVTDMFGLFYNCYSLTSLNLSSFDTSSVTDMFGLFYNCYSLTSLDLSSFNTSSVINMMQLFSNCHGLTSLDLSSFDTSSVTNMIELFSNCNGLTSLDLSSFDTSSVTDMFGLFSNCSGLQSLNLSNLDFSNVKYYNEMFYGCLNLEYINLNHLNLHHYYDISSMFEGCIKLKYINLYSLNTNDIECNIFDNCSNNFTYCIENIENENLSNYIIELGNTTRDCSKNCYPENRKLIVEANKCHCFYCAENETHRFEYNQNCYINCPKKTTVKIKDSYLCEDLNCRNYYNYNQTECINEIPVGYYLNDSIEKTIDKCNINCKTCKEKNLCLSCNDNYYQIYNDSLNNGAYINCYKSPEGYYLDKDNYYKPCYSTCKICNEYGNENNHKCIECNNLYPFKYNYSNYIKCYDKCPYYYIDNKNTFICTEKKECIKEYNKLIEEENICVNNCIKYDPYKYEYNNKCYKQCPSNTISINYICQKGSIELNDIQDKIKNGSYNISEGKEIIIENEGTTFTITTTEHQKKNEKENVTTINLGECEEKLKDEYNIPKDKSLYILKIDIKEEGMKIPIIEYEIYYPLDGVNLETLNLDVCENTKVSISIPVSIDEKDIDKYNTSSGFYNDICYPYTSEKGTDVTLDDRKKEFVENNMTLCEEDCDFKGYDSNTKKALCSCNVKIKLPFFSEISINKTKLYEKFINIANIINLKIVKCYQILFSKEGISKNISIYIIIPIIIFHSICIIIFYFRDYKMLKYTINKILFFKRDSKNSYDIIMEINQSKNKNNKSNNNFSPIKNNKINKNIKNYSINAIKTNDIVSNTSYKNMKPTKNQIDVNSNQKKDISLVSYNSNTSSNEDENIMKYDDYELNILSYEKALKFDKRTYIQYYISILKTKHILIFSFYHSDYNSRIIKIDLLFISFAIYYTSNALFFNDSTMHKIYEDEGSYNFIYQIPQILYSTLISNIFKIFLKTIALSEKNILQIKNNDKNINLDKKSQKISKCLFYKFISFFIISFIFLFFFLYYLSCFCAVFKNTQLHLIKDTFISFILCLIYPFVLYLLPGIFRIPSLRSTKKNRYILYKLSNLIELIV